MNRWLSWALLAVGAMLLVGSGGYFGLVAVSRFQAGQFRNEALPVEQRRPVLLPAAPPAVNETTPPLTREWRAFLPPDHVSIPSIGVDSQVVPVGVVVNAQGELEWETPKNAVGHNAGTANPGSPGNMVLSGHISSPIRHEGNVFNHLPEVKLGDEVLVGTPEGTYIYQVISRRVVEPTEVSVMDPTPEPAVTLITCYPDLIYTHRLVLRAEPVAFQPAPR